MGSYSAAHFFFSAGQSERRPTTESTNVMSGEPSDVEGRAVVVVDDVVGASVVELIVLDVDGDVVVAGHVIPITYISTSLASVDSLFLVPNIVQSVRVAGHTTFVCEQKKSSLEA